MKKLFFKFYGIWQKAQSALEFLVVFSILLLFFLIVADVGLFFNEIYSVQAAADEALARLTASNRCANTENVVPLLVKSVERYRPGWKNAINFTYNAANKTYTSTDKRNTYIFTLHCRTDNIPSSLILSHRYYGLFMFAKGKYVTSNVSTNTTFY